MDVRCACAARRWKALVEAIVTSYPHVYTRAAGHVIGDADTRHAGAAEPGVAHSCGLYSYRTGRTLNPVWYEGFSFGLQSVDESITIEVREIEP